MCVCVYAIEKEMCTSDLSHGLLFTSQANTKCNVVALLKENHVRCHEIGCPSTFNVFPHQLQCICYSFGPLSSHKTGRKEVTFK